MSSASAAAWAAAKPFSAMPGPRALPFGTLPRYFLPGWLQGEERYSFDRLHHKGEWLQRRFGGGEGGAVREDIVPGAPIVWLYSPGDIAEMFASEGKCPSRRSHLALEHYRLGKPSLYSSAGLLPTNGPAWESLRRRFQFRPSALDKVLPHMDQLAQELAQLLLLEKNNSEDADFAMTCLKRYFFEANNVFLFGAPLEGLRGARPGGRTRRMLEATEKTNGNILVTDRVELWRKVETKSFRALREGQETIESFAQEMLDRHGFRLADITEGTSEKDLFTFVSDMLLAGIDTTSYTTAFLLYHLSLNPSEQDQVRSQCRPGGLEAEQGLLRGFRRGKAALKESTRLNPISVGVGRISDRDAVFSGCRVPRGTVLVSQNQVSCRMDKYFGRPTEFLPSRWDREKDKEEEISSLAHTQELVRPFGAGRRSCVGRRLAEQAILVALNRILESARLSWKGKVPLDCETKLINKPDSPLEFKIEKI